MVNNTRGVCMSGRKIYISFFGLCEHIFMSLNKYLRFSSLCATRASRGSDNQAVFVILLREIYKDALVKWDESLAPKVLLNSINIPAIFIKPVYGSLAPYACFPSPLSPPKVQHANEAEASAVLCTTVYVSDSIYELCQADVKLRINIYYCDDIANPSLGTCQDGNGCFL